MISKPGIGESSTRPSFDHVDLVEFVECSETTSSSEAIVARMPTPNAVHSRRQFFEGARGVAGEGASLGGVEANPSMAC